MSLSYVLQLKKSAVQYLLILEEDIEHKIKAISSKARAQEFNKFDT